MSCSIGTTNPWLTQATPFVPVYSLGPMNLLFAQSYHDEVHDRRTCQCMVCQEHEVSYFFCFFIVLLLFLVLPSLPSFLYSAVNILVPAISYQSIVIVL